MVASSVFETKPVLLYLIREHASSSFCRNTAVYYIFESRSCNTSDYAANSLDGARLWPVTATERGQMSFSTPTKSVVM